MRAPHGWWAHENGESWQVAFFRLVGWFLQPPVTEAVGWLLHEKQLGEDTK